MTNFNPVLYPTTVYNITATIPNGQTTSNAIDLQDYSMVGILMPAAFTGITMTFTGSIDDVNFFPLYNSVGTQLQITCAPSIIISFVPGDFAGIRYIKLISGSNEGADRVITFMLRSLM